MPRSRKSRSRSRRSRKSHSRSLVGSRPRGCGYMSNRHNTRALERVPFPRHQYKLVWDGIYNKTSSGLTKNDLIKNKRGKIVSKKKHNVGKARYARGEIGFLRGASHSKKSRSSRKHRSPLQQMIASISRGGRVRKTTQRYGYSS